MSLKPSFSKMMYSPKTAAKIGKCMLWRTTLNERICHSSDRNLSNWTILTWFFSRWSKNFVLKKNQLLHFKFNDIGCISFILIAQIFEMIIVQKVELAPTKIWYFRKPRECTKHFWFSLVFTDQLTIIEKPLLIWLKE